MKQTFPTVAGEGSTNTANTTTTTTELQQLPQLHQNGHSNHIISHNLTNGNSVITTNGNHRLSSANTSEKHHLNNNNNNKNLPRTHGPVRILHFNDCYNVESKEVEPKGGAARFKTALDKFRDPNTLVLFSGDILGPSIMSTVTKGIHMVPVLNECRVDCAVLGNHDFDFGIDNLTIFMEKTNFDWLISNVVDIETNLPLGNGKKYQILERNGVRFGLLGLVEEEWLATLSTISKDDVVFTDYVVEGRRLARFLRQTHNVDYVIALTHMRLPNDTRLAEQVAEIDLILGGHDHDYECLKVNGKYVIKSGTDFREFSVIDLKPTVNREDQEPEAGYKSLFDLKVNKVEVNSNEYVEDAGLKQQLEAYIGLVESSIDTVLGHFGCDLDGRFSHIRTEETNLGNFVTDIMLAATHSDLALLNSGTLRSDRIHKKGPFKLRDLFQILPMLDPMIVLEVTGYQIWKSLENGVSQYPKFEGRFPQVSGVQFAFDPRKPAGNRIDPRYIRIGDEYLDLAQKYRMVTKAYLHQGKDGYDVLKGSLVLVEEEDCPELTITIQNHFEAIDKILTGKAPSHTHHRQSLICLSRRHSLVKHLDLDHNMNLTANAGTIKHPPPAISPTPVRKNSIDVGKRRNSRRMSIEELEVEQCRLEPKKEGRIIKITNDEILAELDLELQEYFESLQRIDQVDATIDEIPEEPEELEIQVNNHSN